MEYILYYFILCGVGMFLAPKDSKVYSYSKRSLISLDQGFNVWLLNGDPDETISSRAYKRSLEGSKAWTLLVKFLDFLDENHGEKSVEWDEGTNKGKATLIKKPKQTQQR